MIKINDISPEYSRYYTRSKSDEIMKHFTVINENNNNRG